MILFMNGETLGLKVLEHKMGYEDLFEVRVNKLDLDEHPEAQVGIIVYLKRKES